MPADEPKKFNLFDPSTWLAERTPRPGSERGDEPGYPPGYQHHDGVGDDDTRDAPEDSVKKAKEDGEELKKKVGHYDDKGNWVGPSEPYGAVKTSENDMLALVGAREGAFPTGNKHIGSNITTGKPATSNEPVIT